MGLYMRASVRSTNTFPATCRSFSFQLLAALGHFISLLGEERCVSFCYMYVEAPPLLVIVKLATSKCRKPARTVPPAWRTVPLNTTPYSCVAHMESASTVSR